MQAKIHPKEKNSAQAGGFENNQKAGDERKERPSWNKIVPHVQPIYQTSVYDYPDLETLDDYYNGLIPSGYIYSRNGLPNSSDLAIQVAKLERAEAGVVCSSGMGAILVALLANLRSGDHVVASSDLYGGTVVLLQEELSNFGIKTTFVDANSISNVQEGIVKGKTKLVLVETISNPIMKICDIEKISKIAHGS